MVPLSMPQYLFTDGSGGPDLVDDMTECSCDRGRCDRTAIEASQEMVRVSEAARFVDRKKIYPLRCERVENCGASTRLGCRRPRRSSSFSPASSRHQRPPRIAVWLGFPRWTAHCDFAFMRPFRLTVKTTRTGKTLGTLSSHARQVGVPPSFLSCSTIASHPPSSWTVCLTVLPALQ